MDNILKQCIDDYKKLMIKPKHYSRYNPSVLIKQISQEDSGADSNWCSDSLIESYKTIECIENTDTLYNWVVKFDSVLIQVYNRWGKEIRKSTGLSQSQFCRLIDVHVSTLRNWEQGRRNPQGSAVALLRIAEQHPKVFSELK